MTSKNTNSLPGWERLRHGGLLLDSARLLELAKFVPTPLNDYTSQKLRQHANAMLEEPGNRSQFVTFVLEAVCRIDQEAGFWDRGSRVAPKWNRQTVTGESLKPDHLWRGKKRGLLPVFIDKAKRIGVGNGRRTVSRALGWLRAGDDPLAILTNGLQWRLLFAGLDYDAWCEWNLDLWFEDGKLSSQVTCLRTLIQGQLWEPDDEGSEAPLLKAIRDTRKGQADLSESLGERVRKAVEILIQGHGDALKKLDSVERADIYRAACRIAMRCVVILFAESRDLLPRDNALYHQSYGLNGLIDQLNRRAAHKHALTECYAAWPRVLALFGLVYEGSHHPDLPIIAYGGGLFEPGRHDSEEGISRALAILESDSYDNTLLPDEDVRRVLEHLTRTTMRIRQGHTTTRIEHPVDFSDLSSEYIGLLYEGLLDYDLKTAPLEEPVVFLSVGNQPALPLSTLEEMDDSTVKSLFKNLSKHKENEENDFSDAESITAAEAEDLLERSTGSDIHTITEDLDSVTDERYHCRARADHWSRRAVVVSGLVKPTKRRPTQEERIAREHAIRRQANQLVARIVLPGEWYLVRYGGTRKGSGSFYTRPGLAIPTVQRTLRPLAYDATDELNVASQNAMPTTQWKPKTPEEILDITVCDPACGSGTFPHAALRFLTEALYLSLQVYQRIQSIEGKSTIVALLRDSADNHTRQERLSQEHLPCPPEHEDFEPRLKAVLRRHVIERCIYAVDIDPLAVELCRLSLWIATMDRSLPFGFLDHKIKCGNALIGTRFDQFHHFPVMAWKNRDGGDRNHSNGVHFTKNSQTLAIKKFVSEKLKPSLKEFLQGQTLFQEDLLLKTSETHRRASQTIAKMHAMPMHRSFDRREIYQREFIGSRHWRTLKEEMDLWCACWFWPLDDESIGHAPLPTTFVKPSEQTRSIAKRIARDINFFHWELEFPDVFHRLGSGFDAILGNPPWNVAKPASKEFFTNIDPMYNSYGKQEALLRQSQYFTDRTIEQSWLEYIARFRAHSNFAIYASNPWGDPSENENSKHRFAIVHGPSNLKLHDRWRRSRTSSVGFSDAPHPFSFQGGADFNLYKLFLEIAHALLKKPNPSDGGSMVAGGRLGFIVPSGVYSDHATQQLRDLFLKKCRWEWLFGFENRYKIFPIDGRQKFCAVIIEKGGRTESINAAFMRHDVSDWDRAELLSTLYAVAQVERFSPETHSILEISSMPDLNLLESVYRAGVLLGDSSSGGWSINYAREFDPTLDSNLFHTRQYLENMHYLPDEYNRWIQGAWSPLIELLQDTDSNDVVGIHRDPEVVHNLGNDYWGGDVIVPVHQQDGTAHQPHSRRRMSRHSLSSGIILSRDGEQWIHEKNVTGVALPVYEGRMIGQFDFSQKAWISGKGRSAVWKLIPWEAKRIEPQFLMDADTCTSKWSSFFMPKCAHMNVASATNTRTAISTMVHTMPAGNGTAIFRSPSLSQAMALTGIMNSFVFDAMTRMRLVGLHLDYNVLKQSAIPEYCQTKTYSAIVDIVTKLNLPTVMFSPHIIRLRRVHSRRDWHFSLAKHERIRSVAVLNALVAVIYRISVDDMAWILRDCDIPVSRLQSSVFTRRLNPKGFWRIDQGKDPELRQTVLSFIAFCDLKSMIDVSDGDIESGVTAFLDQNEGEGWMVPAQLCLRDYGIGQDERADVPQLVARRLGPRFHDWQLTQNAQDFWREAHLHARNILGAEGYSALIAEIVAERIGGEVSPFDRLVCDLAEDFVSEQGYFDVLIELRRRRLVESDDLLVFAASLLDKGHLSSRIHSEFIDIVNTKPADDDSESDSGGRPQLDLFKWRRQTDLFD